VVVGEAEERELIENLCAEVISHRDGGNIVGQLCARVRHLLLQLFTIAQ